MIRSRFLSSAVSVLAVLVLSPTAAAQMIGNPVYYAPKHGMGLTIAGDYGRGINEASGKGNYFGGRAILGLPFVTVSAGLGSVSDQGAGERELSYGATAALNILDIPLVPVGVALQGGAGIMSLGPDASLLHVPIGVAVGLKPPAVGLGVEGWVAPRIDIMRQSLGGQSDTDVRVGASAGINVRISGLGVHAALDYIRISGTDTSPLMLGVGVHYKLSIPILGAVM